MCPTGQVIFKSGHVIIFPAVYISSTELVHILAGHMKIFAGHVNFQNHVPNGLKSIISYHVDKPNFTEF